MSGTTRDHNKTSKLNQIIQNFFAKAAQVIIQSRIAVNPVYARGTSTPKVNKWFNLELEETDAFREDLRFWKTSDVFESSVPPLVVETFLDIKSLGAHQSLVVADCDGRTWNANKVPRRNEVVLERWIIEFISSDTSSINESSTELPVVYKKAIILFRSLYTYCRLLPTWNLKRKLIRAKLAVSPIYVGCRVLNGSQPISSRGRIGLTKAIVESKESHLETFTVGNVETPVGSLRISVSYRTDCDFRVSDSEALLSSHFLNLDESKSVSNRRLSLQGTPSPSSNQFGSVTTSPYRQSTDQSQSASGSYVSINQTSDRRLSGGSRTSLRSAEQTSPIQTTGNSGSHVTAGGKHPVSFIQPFKSPSLTASPSESVISNPPPQTGVPRLPSTSSLAALRAPQRTVSNASQTSVKNIVTSGIPPENAIASSGSSRESVPRFSSSFGNRTQWRRTSSASNHSRTPSFFGNPASVESDTSSLMEPGSGIYVEDESLGNFVKMVDSARSLKDDTSGRVTVARDAVKTAMFERSIEFESDSGTINNSAKNLLARFQLLRGNHAALSDSLQASLYLPKSESGSGSGSGGIGSSAMAIMGHSSQSIVSTSPAHKGSNHTPLVPSRLSEEFTADGTMRALYQSQPRRQPSKGSMRSSSEGPSDHAWPLDIPASLSTNVMREPSSVSNTRTIGYDDMHEDISEGMKYQSLNPRPTYSRDSEAESSNARSREKRYSLYTGSAKVAEASSEKTSEDIPKSFASGNLVEDVNDDDELLFAMSDMHMTKSEPMDPTGSTYESLQWQSSKER